MDDHPQVSVPFPRRNGGHCWLLMRDFEIPVARKPHLPSSLKIVQRGGAFPNMKRLLP
jgi:hypothetical protein